MIFKLRPDPIQCREQLAMLQEMHRAYGTDNFMSLAFWILTKKPVVFRGSRGIPMTLVPFRPNLVQMHLSRNCGKKNLVVKARQMGITTWFLLVRLFLPIILNPGRNAFLVAHRSVSAEKTLRMAHRALRWFLAFNPQNPEENVLCDELRANLLHTMYSNRRELVFDQLDSTLMIGSAEVEEEGQSITIHHFVADEFSRWPGDPHETLSNIKGALTPDATEDIPCTANGMAGEFWTLSNTAMTDSENSPYKFHFFPWYWSHEYREEMTEKEKDELEKDLTSDEQKLIVHIHEELLSVTRQAA